MSPYRIEHVAAGIIDANAELVEMQLKSPAVSLERNLEYYWGLNPGDYDKTIALSSLKVRPRMRSLINPAFLVLGWALVPTMDIVQEMYAFEEHNSNCSLPDRRNYLQALDKKEYEYVFVPITTELDFFVCTPGCEPVRLPREPPYATVIAPANPFPVVHAFQDVTLSGAKLPQLQLLPQLMFSWRINPPSAYLAYAKSRILPPSCPDLVEHAECGDESDGSDSDGEDEEKEVMPFDRSAVDRWSESVEQETTQCDARTDVMSHSATLSAYADEPCSSPPHYPQWLTESETAQELLATTIKLPWRDPKPMKSENKRSCEEVEEVDSDSCKRRRCTS